MPEDECDLVKELQSQKPRLIEILDISMVTGR